jgi:chaperone modulatory protein CbpM
MSTGTDWLRLEPQETVTVVELSRMCALSEAELRELVDYGVLAPLPGPEGLLFAADCVAPLRHAARVRADFDLDLFTLGLLLGYLRRIDELERRLHSLRAQVPLRAQPHHGDERPGHWREEHGGAHQPPV